MFDNRPRQTHRRARRHETTRAEIVEAAWVLVRVHGLAGLTMRDLATQVGMSAPSLYSYFTSKHEIFDAMFAQGYSDFIDWMAAVPDTDAGAARARAAGRHYLAFCTTDPVRFQLLFQRTIPGFEPSPESYALAVRSLEQMSELLAELGVTASASIDLWTAVMTGLASQQIANDPGGDRWARLVDDAADMLLAHTAPSRPPRRPR